jgi:hypothetical protein
MKGYSKEFSLSHPLFINSTINVLFIIWSTDYAFPSPEIRLRDIIFFGKEDHNGSLPAKAIVFMDCNSVNFG